MVCTAVGFLFWVFGLVVMHPVLIAGFIFSTDLMYLICGVSIAYEVLIVLVKKGVGLLEILQPTCVSQTHSHRFSFDTMKVVMVF